MITRSQLTNSSLNRELFGTSDLTEEAGPEVLDRIRYLMSTFVEEVNRKIPGTYCISCFRTKRLNIALNERNVENGLSGSSQFSRHLVAAALDLKNDRYSPPELRDLIRNLVVDYGKVGFIKVYPTFVHVEPFIPARKRFPSFLNPGLPIELTYRPDPSDEVPDEKELYRRESVNDGRSGSSRPTRRRTSRFTDFTLRTGRRFSYIIK